MIYIDAKKVIETRLAEFDRILPGYVWMSDVKKIDFYLWSIRD